MKNESQNAINWRNVDILRYVLTNFLITVGFLGILTLFLILLIIERSSNAMELILFSTILYLGVLLFLFTGWIQKARNAVIRFGYDAENIFTVDGKGLGNFIPLTDVSEIGSAIRQSGSIMVILRNGVKIRIGPNCGGEIGKSFMDSVFSSLTQKGNKVRFVENKNQRNKGYYLINDSIDKTS